MWRSEDNSVEPVSSGIMWIPGTKCRPSCWPKSVCKYSFRSEYFLQQKTFKDEVPLVLLYVFIFYLKKSNSMLLFLKCFSSYNPIAVKLFLSPTISMYVERYLKSYPQRQVWCCTSITQHLQGWEGNHQFKGSLGNIIRLCQKQNSNNKYTKKRMLTVINNFIFCSGGTEATFQKLMSLYFLKLTYTLFKFTFFGDRISLNILVWPWIHWVCLPWLYIPNH